MLKLFYSPNSCALASHIALQEAGADYETVRLDFRANEQRKPEYLAINPKGRVPALATDRGILTETPAILAFIAQSFPQARLAPLDDRLRLRRACRPSTAISAPPSTSPTPIACAARAGSTPATPPPSRRCRRRCRNPSANASS